MKEVKFTELAGFQPKQLEALKAMMEFKYLFYGGAAGGGKSYYIRWASVYLLMYYAQKYGLKGVRVGIFCEDYPALKERHLSKVPFEFPEYLGTLNKSEHEFTVAPEYGGGVIAFRNLDDPSKYLSSEFAAIFVDEMTKNKRQNFDFLNMRLRWVGIPDPKFVGASNPGGIGHGWVKKLWINRDFSGETFKPKDFAFVQAFYSDNKMLPEEYGEQLASLPEDLRRAYRDGDWDCFEGQFFPEFSRERNVRSLKDFLADEKTRTWWDKLPVVGGLDYGYKNPSCHLSGKYDADTDKWYIFKELYKAGLEYPDLGKEIVVIGQPEVEYYDPSIAAKKDSPRSGLDELKTVMDCGMKPGFNERVQGWTIVRDYLDNGRLIIFDNCVNLIREISELVYFATRNKQEDSSRIEDCAKIDDHAPDALRYMIATHKRVLAQTKKLSYETPKTKPKEPESDFDEAFGKNNSSNYNTARVNLTL